MKIVVRHAGPEDSGVISGIQAASWRDAYGGILPRIYLEKLADGLWEPFYTQWMESGWLTARLLALDGEPVGFVAWGRSKDNPGWGEIHSLHLLPGFRGQGLGTRLLEEAQKELEAEGYSRVCLWTLEEYHPSRRFYESHGYRGDDKPFLLDIWGSPVQALWYRKGPAKTE